MKKALYTGLEPTFFKTDSLLFHLPLIQIVPKNPNGKEIQNCLSLFSEYTHILITSKSTIPILKEFLLHSRHTMDDWKKKKTIAIGQSTTHHLKQMGVVPYKIALKETAEGILDVINEEIKEGNSFFWPHSSQARTVITDGFKHKNVSFNECAIYDTLPLVHKILPDIASFDEIIFTSPSTIDAFIHIFGSLPKKQKLIPIGPITEDYLYRIKQLIN